MTEELRYEVRQRVATLTLNRPQASNALSPELASALILRIRDADADPAVKCIAIAAEGDNFSAGGDIKSFEQTLSLPPAERYDLFERRLQVGNRLPQVLLDCSKPIVVAAQGAVAGAGMSLCLAADFTLCSENAYFLAAHVHVGLCLDCGLSGLLIGAMGVKAAKRLAMLGERISAAEARELGIVTRVVPAAELGLELEKLTARLAAGPAIALAGTKQMLNHAAYPGFTAQLAEETAGIARCAASDDFRHGVEGALARRPARFD
jgi:2-(1,2-epoxy-1,2-dihydrophenyl)acetyl-CoA isomerase